MRDFSNVTKMVTTKILIPNLMLRDAVIDFRAASLAKETRASYTPDEADPAVDCLLTGVIRGINESLSLSVTCVLDLNGKTLVLLEYLLEHTTMVAFAKQSRSDEYLQAPEVMQLVTDADIWEWDDLKLWTIDRLTTALERSNPAGDVHIIPFMHVSRPHYLLFRFARDRRLIRQHHSFFGHIELIEVQPEHQTGL